jgi:hypothetical protein
VFVCAQRVLQSDVSLTLFQILFPSLLVLQGLCIQVSPASYEG